MAAYPKNALELAGKGGGHASLPKEGGRLARGELKQEDHVMGMELYFVCDGVG